jgi:hypothetical protein
MVDAIMVLPPLPRVLLFCLRSRPRRMGGKQAGRQQGHARRPHAERSPKGEHRTGEDVAERTPVLAPASAMRR